MAGRPAAPSAEWSAAGQLAERYMDGQVVGAAGDGDGDPLSGRAMAGAWDRAVASALPGCPTNWITSPGGQPGLAGGPGRDTRRVCRGRRGPGFHQKAGR
jgi:hypothetical protein